MSDPKLAHQLPFGRPLIVGLCLCFVQTLVQAETAAEPVADDVWDYSVWAAVFFVADDIYDDDDYGVVIVDANHDRLHLEARYNYEGLHTASLWAGYNFEFGTKIDVEITPLLGVVFGRTNGVAPGLEASLTWRWVDLYYESEYLVDTDDRDDSFFYSWSLLGVSPTDWLNFGLVIQRTQTYETPRDTQRGPYAEFSYRQLTVGAYAFNPTEHFRSYALSIEVDF